jgi:quercetin dioxygenase-like cupin family protein
VSYRAVIPDELEWETRPTEPGEPGRQTGQLSERAGLRHARANLWRYEPGAQGRRHRHPTQDETFVVIRGSLTMYLGEPPERVAVGQGGVIHVEAETPLQIRNEGDDELLLYIHGWPPESANAEILESAI